MTANQEDNMTAWYWGALRAACAALNWPRAWQLVAAWPRFDGLPDEAPPQEYVVREALSSDRLNDALEWRWCLEHYRAQPIPLPSPPSPSAPPLLPFPHGAGGVFILKGDTDGGARRDGAVSADVRGGDGTGAVAVVRFRKPARTGRVGGGMSIELMPRPHLERRSTSRIYPGFRMADHICFAATAKAALDTADLLIRAGETARNTIRLLSRLRQGEAAEVRCDMIWCADIRERLLEEGPDAHPDLVYSHRAPPSHLESGLREALVADLPRLNELLGEGFWDGSGHAWPEPEPEAAPVTWTEYPNPDPRPQRNEEGP